MTTKKKKKEQKDWKSNLSVLLASVGVGWATLACVESKFETVYKILSPFFLTSALIVLYFRNKYLIIMGVKPIGDLLLKHKASIIKTFTITFVPISIFFCLYTTVPAISNILLGVMSLLASLALIYPIAALLHEDTIRSILKGSLLSGISMFLFGYGLKVIWNICLYQIVNIPLPCS